jgi:hypothetical protein
MALNRFRGRDMPTAQVKHLVDQVVRGKSPVTYSKHVKQRMREREFSTQDIQYVLETGKYSKGYWDADWQNHEFTVSGMDLNGEELELACAVFTAPTCLNIMTGKRGKNDLQMPRQKNEKDEGDR